MGPDADVLELVGNKSSARAAAIAAGVPVLPATEGPSSVEDIRAFFAAQDGAIMIKALAGGGGRGMRKVHSADQIDDAYRQCAAEAQLGFGDPALFAEALLDDARHIEVQIVAAPAGHQTHALALGDRDCSIQRRYQKLVEIAPAQGLSDDLRRNLHQAAVRLCASVGLRGLATVEFLVAGEKFVFLEVNPRIQVEHTVTEETTGVDLVAVQLAIAGGASYYQLGLPAGIASDGSEVIGEPAARQGIAIQARVNMETFAPDGSVAARGRHADGVLAAERAGCTRRHLRTCRAGPQPAVRLTAGQGHHPCARIVVAGGGAQGQDRPGRVRHRGHSHQHRVTARVAVRQSASVGLGDDGFLDEKLPELAAAALSRRHDIRVAAVELYPGEEVLRAQLAGTVVEMAAEGAEFGRRRATGRPRGDEDAARARRAGRAADRAEPGGRRPGRRNRGPVAGFHPHRRPAPTANPSTAAIDLDRPRADLDEVAQRHLLTLDEGRPAAVAKRHNQGRRTARENIADLVDAGSFVEYGALAIAAQRSRRSEEDLIANTPADGLVAGLATIGADRFGRAAAEAVVVSYDYTVLAGTQGMRNHAKTDRVFDLAARKQLPVVLFAEGGGGRPGDTDVGGHAGLDVPTFRVLAGLSGRVPLVSIVSGRCFAGNAALAGVCDVIIATPDANIGMGGPAMIEGGGLGVYPPEAIGPIDVQRHNGVVSLVARDEAHAVALAKQYLSYFQGSLGDWEAPDPRLARHVVPQNRLRAYDVHRAIESIVDVGSVLELRPDYGVGIVTALVRVEGVAYGLIANSSHHLGGAIDAEAADKAGDFLGTVRVVPVAGDLAVRHPRVHGRAGRGKRGRRPPIRPDVRRSARG